ncbi:GNAT family N-acetyltransferase [Myroides sp. LJL115]
MDFPNTITGNDITLEKIKTNQAGFILELVNTPTWLEFIGQRNVHTLQQSVEYIEKIIQNQDFEYYCILDKEQQTLGVISFIKRDYLPLWDLGFALLPTNAKKGIAFLACNLFIDYLKENTSIKEICAITDPQNQRSISLLQRLCFNRIKSIRIDQDSLEYFILDL